MQKLSTFISTIILLTGMQVNAQFSIPKVLIEVFTGSWSGYSPDGEIRLEEVLSTYEDAIAVNIHNGDAMTISEESDLTGFYSPAYPQAVLNRTGTLYSRGSWLSTTGTMLQTPATVTVSFDSIRYNSGTRLLDVYIKAVFTGAEAGDMRFNCIVSEDMVTGTGSGYNQVNYLNTTPGHPYYGAGDPIIGYEHLYVARDYLGDAWGISGSIPASANFGTTATYHFSTALNASWNENNITLIGFVCNYDGSALGDRRILNSVEFSGLFPPEPEMTLSSHLVCRGNTIDYSYAGTDDATQYYWEFAGGTPATSTAMDPGPVYYDVAGNYTTKLTVTGIAGSASVLGSVSIIGIDTQVNLTDSSLIANLSGATYQWYDCSSGFIALSGETNREFVHPGSGEYAVVISSGACIDTSDCIDVLSFSIDEPSLNLFTVYPNPSDEVVNFAWTEAGWLRICTVDGRLVSETQCGIEKTAAHMKLEPGSYVVSFIGEQGIETKRLLITR